MSHVLTEDKEKQDREGKDDNEFVRMDEVMRRGEFFIPYYLIFYF